MDQIASKLKLRGYDLLGEEGQEGIRYAWKYADNKNLLESAAFVEKTKGMNQNISGYTTSVSLGCILRSIGCPCSFCRTGKMLPFSKMLSAVDIAKQNILMVLTDLNCSDHIELRSNKREFAYMGQGEPGYSYTQVRMAIKITNAVMKTLGQEVHRHIISTSGVPEMIVAFKDDIKNIFFDSRVTMHFSLHATEERDSIMPINCIYPYKSVLGELSPLYNLTGEKPCIGIILFNKFKPSNNKFTYSNDTETIEKVLNDIDSSVFRISLCEFNNVGDLGKSESFEKTKTDEIVELAKEKGFEVKLFSSFGKKEKSACGMLGGKEPEKNISDKWIKLEEDADKLIKEALKEIEK